MPKSKKPRRTFQKYVAYRDVPEHNQESLYVVLARAGQYRRDYGLHVGAVCQIDYYTGEAFHAYGFTRVQPEDLVAQADTFLGIVVKIEQLIKRQKAEASA